MATTSMRCRCRCQGKGERIERISQLDAETSSFALVRVQSTPPPPLPFLGFRLNDVAVHCRFGSEFCWDRATLGGRRSERTCLTLVTTDDVDYATDQMSCGWPGQADLIGRSRRVARKNGIQAGGPFRSESMPQRMKGKMDGKRVSDTFKLSNVGDLPSPEQRSGLAAAAFKKKKKRKKRAWSSRPSRSRHQTANY